MSSLMDVNDALRKASLEAHPDAQQLLSSINYYLPPPAANASSASAPAVLRDAGCFSFSSSLPFSSLLRLFFFRIFSDLCLNCHCPLPIPGFQFCSRSCNPEYLKSIPDFSLPRLHSHSQSHPAQLLYPPLLHLNLRTMMQLQFLLQQC